jgi:hypothetical protein
MFSYWLERTNHSFEDINLVLLIELMNQIIYWSNYEKICGQVTEAILRNKLEAKRQSKNQRKKASLWKS